MNRRLDELLLQRGRLLERIAGQRASLSHDMAPVAGVLGKADAAAAWARSLAASIRRHPVAVSLAAASLLAIKGRTLLRWGGRAFSLWRSWQMIQSSLQNLGGRIRL